MKICQQCKTKPTLGNSTLCHQCYYEKNPEKYKIKIKNSAEYKKKNKEKHALYVKKAQLKIRYGLTYEQYLDMFKTQNNQCAICGYKHKEEYKGTQKSLCVDHNHKTQYVRGLLCKRCNVGLGYFNDDPMLLEKAINYIRNESN